MATALKNHATVDIVLRINLFSEENYKRKIQPYKIGFKDGISIMEFCNYHIKVNENQKTDQFIKVKRSEYIQVDKNSNARHIKK